MNKIGNRLNVEFSWVCSLNLKSESYRQIVHLKLFYLISKCQFRWSQILQASGFDDDKNFRFNRVAGNRASRVVGRKISAAAVGPFQPAEPGVMVDGEFDSHKKFSHRFHKFFRDISPTTRITSRAVRSSFMSAATSKSEHIGSSTDTCTTSRWT